MTLNELLGQNASYGFDVVDILRIICEELALLLKQVDEGVCGSESVGIW